MPVSEIVRVGSVALLVTVIFPGRLPADGGANAADKFADWPAAKVSGNEIPDAE